jgi:ferritin-like metal-binding protein YciE
MKVKGDESKTMQSSKLQSPKDLFIHELGGMYDAEQKIAQMLPMMAQETNNPQIKNALQQHEQETKQQINNLEQCFQVLGMQPASVACMTVAGLKQEHDTFLKEKPSEEVLNLFNLDAADKTEYFEIASYKGLIEKANLMSQRECISLLQQNLRQEEAMAQKVETLSHEIGKQAITR